MLGRTKIFLLTSIAFLAGAPSTDAQTPYEVPKSSVEAAERQLEREENSERRIQLLLRWIQIKEEYEQSRTEADPVNYLQYKEEIIKKIQSEFEKVSDQSPELLDKLYRELGSRFLEIRKYQQSYEAFLEIEKRTPEDELSLGDALLSAELPTQALDSYKKAMEGPAIESMAAYKKGWAHLQLDQPKKAIDSFDRALQPSKHTDTRLQREAYQDRLIPYLETFDKESFTKEDATALRELAEQVYVEDENEQKQVYIDALKELVRGFTSKNDVDVARDIFRFLSNEVSDTHEILFFAAPIWIKVYRGRLNHRSVERIVQSLPGEPVPKSETSELRRELYNTAVFYENYVSDDKEEEPLLFEIYKKYFELYPEDQDADPIRINFSQLLLAYDQPGYCLSILENRQDNEEELAHLALSLEGRCTLNALDKLYDEEHTPSFYDRLDKALLVDKVYTYPDLGVSAKEAFESLTRMLIGALGESPHEGKLRRTLTLLIEDYPFSKDDELFFEIGVLRSELRFEDLLISKKKPSEKSRQFYNLFKESPLDSEVAEKSLKNSVLMGRDRETLKYCNDFKEIYEESFTLESGVFDRCIEIAQYYLMMREEYSLWMEFEDQLTHDQLIDLAVLELGLGHETQGPKRLKDLDDPEAQRILDRWKGKSPKKEYGEDQEFQALRQETASFIDRKLEPIDFDEIEEVVPQNIDAFEKLDEQWAEHYQNSSEGYWKAHSLEQRAILAGEFYNWFRSLPEPPEMSEEELEDYRKQAEQVIQPWKETAKARREDCSEIAHTLSMDFQYSSEAHCPDNTPLSIVRDEISKWQQSRQRRGKLQQRVLTLLHYAQRIQDEEPRKARFALWRAFDVAENDRERARAELALAKLTGYERHWYNAASFDGNLIEPLEWLKEQSEGNPFFEGLYERKLRYIRGESMR